jgi:DNA gyrase/topoisomerase IV subunit B
MRETPNKSRLKSCTLNAGVSGDSYQTSGGLHGVPGSSVVNALSDHLRVSCDQQTVHDLEFFTRGVPQAP